MKNVIQYCADYRDRGQPCSRTAIGWRRIFGRSYTSPYELLVPFYNFRKMLFWQFYAQNFKFCTKSSLDVCLWILVRQVRRHFSFKVIENFLAISPNPSVVTLNLIYNRYLLIINCVLTLYLYFLLMFFIK